MEVSITNKFNIILLRSISELNQTIVQKGVFEKIGVEPQVVRIGKYKSYGDRIARKNMSEENREMLTKVLDNIYWNWVDKISQAKGEVTWCYPYNLDVLKLTIWTIYFTGKKKEEIETFINEGVYHIEKLKEDGWITDIKYDDEVSARKLKNQLSEF